MNAAIDSWDGPAYVAPLDTSAAMIFIGSDASEVSLGYGAIAPEILQGFEQARQGARSGAAYRHTELYVGAERGGEAAWWVQGMRYGFEHEGEAREYPFRITGFALREGSRLKVVLAHASLPVGEEDLWRLARAAGRDPTPPRSAAEPVPSGADGAEAELRAHVRELAARFDAGAVPGTLELFADEPDVTVVGPGPESVHVGPDAIPAALSGLQALAPPGGARATARLVSERIVVRTRGERGWWYESGRLRFGHGAEALELPWRSTGAALRRGGAWKVLLLHDDVPVPNDSTLAFSEPAGG